MLDLRDHGEMDPGLQAEDRLLPRGDVVQAVDQIAATIDVGIDAPLGQSVIDLDLPGVARRHATTFQDVARGLSPRLPALAGRSREARATVAPGVADPDVDLLPVDEGMRSTVTEVADRLPGVERHA
ncbi:MAG: hypothetical protein GY856_29835 [bacterium]|nr:hypothetical protein [bacterium]